MQGWKAGACVGGGFSGVRRHSRLRSSVMYFESKNGNRNE